MIEQKYIQTAIDYKKNVARTFVLVEGAKLKQRVDGERFAVTRKIDGHMQVVFYIDGQVFMLNASVKERAKDLKCLGAFAEAVKAAGLKQAVIAAELYLPRPEGRPRCGDVQAALADDAKRDQLALASFDIVEIDGEKWHTEHYADTHNKFCTIFQNEQVKPVEMRNASSKDEVQEIYEEWVGGEDAEGMVAHGESPIVWKLKPELVFEISVLELVARGNDDKIRMNPLLKFDEAQGWLMEGTTPGVSALGITLERERTDKQPNETDVRISQLTDFSSARKEMIKRDMLYSNDEQQIRDLLAAEIADNVKKGWEEII